MPCYQDKDEQGLLAISTLMHMLITVLAYYTCMLALKNHGPDAVIKLSMWSFSIFFATQVEVLTTVLPPSGLVGNSAD